MTGWIISILSFLFFAYIFLEWGIIWGIIVLILLLLVYGSCYLYYRLKGQWPWIAVLTGNLGSLKSVEISETKPKITFADVAGIDETIEELREIVDFIKNREIYVALGGKIPRGVIMMGPPGVGKTLSAQAVAGEANIGFIEMAGSSFVEKFVGVGASNIRDLFKKAKKLAPCIIFIDEFDSLGKRGSGDSGGEQEYAQTINQLLVEMDGFSTNENVVIMAATNRIDKVDEALLRSGRFDRKIYFHAPDLKGREDILGLHSRNKPLAKDINLRNIAKLTQGFTGADLAKILNEAAIAAGKKGGKEITHNDIIIAKERHVLGKEHKFMVIDSEEKRITAYHEAGHALLAAILENCDPPDKVSIIPRDMALGITALSPSKDRFNLSKKFLTDQIVMLLGGKAAEKVACETETAGAKNDIERATNIATAMICEYGMSDQLGPVAVNTDRGFAGSGDSFLQTQAQFEIKKMISESFKKAQDMLQKNIEALHAIASLLLEKETISGEEVIGLIKTRH